MKHLLAFLWLLLPGLALAQSAVVFKTERHDFGTVRQGPRLEFVFDFCNMGTTELVIWRVSPFG